jgi:hypothetical protein
VACVALSSRLWRSPSHVLDGRQYNRISGSGVARAGKRLRPGHDRKMISAVAHLPNDLFARREDRAIFISGRPGNTLICTGADPPPAKVQGWPATSFQ